MSKLIYDPSEYIKGLQQILVSDKKKIVFLFGAGTSVAKKNKISINIPAVAKMTEIVEKELFKKDKYKSAIEEIKSEIGQDNFNIETFLTNIVQKNQIICTGNLNGLNKGELCSLIEETKEQIRKIVSKHKEIFENDGIDNLIHVDFAEWIKRADRKQAIELFTTNYDYFFELGMEEKNIPYYDGFTGSYNPFFHSESVEDLCYLPKQTKLWKIHGSLGWHYNEKNKKVLRTYSDGDDIMIYPSILKYINSKKQPYAALMDRLTNILKQPDTVLITCGYSFNDEHINERIFTALQSNTAAHVYALYYDINWKDGEKIYTLTEDSDIVKLIKTNRKISIYGCRNAVIGCQYGKWKLKRKPDKVDAENINLYFDTEYASKENPINDEKKENDSLSGEGELILPDFTKFVAFLQSMILHDDRR